MLENVLQLPRLHSLSLAQILTHSQGGGPHWDWGCSYPASSVGSREHGTSRAEVLNILQLRELFKGVSYKGHSDQQLQHCGFVLDTQTL